MIPKTVFPALCLALLLATSAFAQSGAKVPSAPPMGWNSWDAYGLAITEQQYKANVLVLAGLARFGWNYSVIDEGWFLENPENAEKPETLKYTLDSNGRTNPAVNRFPSSANSAGFKPIADFTHSLGLKFGIHIIRGIPKRAVEQNLPIVGGQFSAKDAADTTDTCPWNPDNFGIKENAAGQAYYDSVIGLYASWGVDFLKVDCIADHPYKVSEIRMIANAITKSRRPIVLSLSPGPTQLQHAAEVGKLANMWRIADDIWDGWEFKGQTWPNDLLSAFDNLAKWAPYNKHGNWPDADMPPWGFLGPTPGWGKPRQTALTQDELRTQFTLWAIARTPLILGANLTDLDDFTLSLITNKDVIAVSQTSVDSKPVKHYAQDPVSLRYWTADTGGVTPQHYIAVFNVTAASYKVHEHWALFGQLEKPHAVYDIWNKKHVPAAKFLDVEIPAHGCALLRLE